MMKDKKKDISSKKVKSIRDIAVSERREKFNNRGGLKNTRGVSYKAKNKKLWPKISFIFITFIVFFITFSILSHSATVTVSPKTEKLTFSNDVYMAVVDLEESILSTNMKNNQSGNISEGKITIINNTKSDQILKEKTRFQFGQNEQKTIFKIHDRVTIPAEKRITVTAFSAGVGEKYNKEKGTNLKIPGFREAKMTKEYQGIVGIIEETFVTTEKTTSKKQISLKKDGKEALAKIKYQVIEFNLSEQKEISSIGLEEVSKKAKGKIRIINNTNRVQKLRKETRFSNGDLVFKINKSTTIKARSSVVVNAFADVAGEGYNIKKGMEFSIPGFKEANMTREYKNIVGIAESNFTGGKIGKKNIPNKIELESAKEYLKQLLAEKLEIKIIEEKDVIVIGNNFQTQYNFKTESKGDKVLLSLNIIQRVPVIWKENFITMILESEEISTERVDQLKIKNLSNSQFEILNSDKFNIDSGDNFLFSINGNLDIAWVLNEEVFIKSIKGNSVKELKERLKGSFKNFEFNIVISPFWRSMVPNNADSIFIEIEN